ncbi:hypothetical protein PVAP13_8KG272801 [Panicum virgatum]|uniref:Uncharacterized protein n=1 Tax=Panicum virgatum TaxID=38727 RepID=A0A8T0PLS9_PANVG|nr:hypothetical protein PVAP13_8KG272801 [Panicum virgatum]
MSDPTWPLAATCASPVPARAVPPPPLARSHLLRVAPAPLACPGRSPHPGREPAICAPRPCLRLRLGVAQRRAGLRRSPAGAAACEDEDVGVEVEDAWDGAREEVGEVDGSVVEGLVERAADRGDLAADRNPGSSPPPPATLPRRGRPSAVLARSAAPTYRASARRRRSTPAGEGEPDPTARRSAMAGRAPPRADPPWPADLRHPQIRHGLARPPQLRAGEVEEDVVAGASGRRAPPPPASPRRGSGPSAAAHFAGAPVPPPRLT